VKRHVVTDWHASNRPDVRADRNMAVISLHVLQVAMKQNFVLRSMGVA